MCSAIIHALMMEGEIARVMMEVEMTREKMGMEVGVKQDKNTFEYCVKVGSKSIKVCKKVFLNIYAVSQKRVFCLMKLLSQGKVPKDLRGTNLKKLKKTSEDLINKIHDHITSFPLKLTHYGGQDYQYLDARLDIKTMHSLFKSKYPDVKYDFYRAYFKDNFNYSFGRPQIDVCSKCEELKAKLKLPHITASSK
ncbi:hypothetical protein C0J52_05236 [Blattella germanica]|nr:hypothetical protein C0J52_05236 [Blattella germanica]